MGPQEGEEMKDGDSVGNTLHFSSNYCLLDRGAFLKGAQNLRTNLQGGWSDPHLTEEETRLMPASEGPNQSRSLSVALQPCHAAS